MPGTVETEQTIVAGGESFVESHSPTGRLAVVFEDDGGTGYLYALDTSREENPIVDAVHIYNVADVSDEHLPSLLQVVWSDDGLKAALIINDYPHAVFDFEARRGYCRNNFPPPSEEWSHSGDGHAWDAAAIELFK